MATVPSNFPFALSDDDLFDRAYDDVFYLNVPGRDPGEGSRFLQCVSLGGGLAGTGLAFNVNLERIRRDYESEIEALGRGVKERQAQGMKAEQIAEWVSRERANLARRVRLRNQGVAPAVALEIRDTVKYGWRGRSYSNIWNKYAKPNMTR